MDDEDKPNVGTKSPMKKLRKNKKDKKESPPSPVTSSIPQDNDFSNSSESSAAIAPKIKAKKDKNNKLKQLNKQNSSSEVLKAEVPAKSEEIIVSNEAVIEDCPFKTAIESVKGKKQKKRDKKSLSKDESVCSDDVGGNKSELEVTSKNGSSSQLPAPTQKLTKEKKSKSDKKKAVDSNKDCNKDEAQV